MSDPKRIIVVDADPESLRYTVESLGRRVGCVGTSTSHAALHVLENEDFDLVLLDLSLPDITGIGLLRLIRGNPKTARMPIFVVSALASEVDRILAFEAGADDFLAKPFYAPELAVRVRTLLRAFDAQRSAEGHRVVRNRGVSIDVGSGRVEVEGRAVPLTATEFRVLAALESEKGRVVRRRDLIERLRGPDAGQGERTVDAHVKSIRRKLGDARAILETVRGVGYRLSEPPAEPPEAAPEPGA